MTIHRLGPLAAAAWLLCLLLGAARAAPISAAGHGEARAAAHRPVALFSHSENCIACHNNLIAASGEDVSIGTAWRSTMMANSARDPYWQAAVRRETIDHPLHAAAIQDECAECHMPMSTQTARAGGGKGTVFAHLPIAGNNAPLHRLAADSVSCTVCHQISSERLGTPASFNGEFTLMPTPADGARVIFGPYPIDAGRKTIMRSVTGFVQTQGAHIRQSELCASCHTLITEAYGPDGRVIGTLPEQMNYQEWRHSAFYEEGRSCQSCHMRTAPGPIRMSSVLGDRRDTLARHTFVGGNAFMLRMLNRYRTDLGVDALPSELEATATATIRQLREETASLAVVAPRLVAGELVFDVEVRNLSGHKLPTGYPSRRAWLHVKITDGRDRVVFESGAIDERGAIKGNDNDTDPLKHEPHYEQVTDADQVQIYEPILGDWNGVPTTGLHTAVRYLKDNRLLPRGFDKATADPVIGVFGTAADDPDFSDAGDRVRYRLDLSGAEPYTVTVDLLYQSIGYRWAHNLEGYDAIEPQRFLSYNDALATGSAVVLTTASARVVPPADHQSSPR
jgi:hypothetical protein